MRSRLSFLQAEAGHADDFNPFLPLCPHNFGASNVHELIPLQMGTILAMSVEDWVRMDPDLIRT